MDTTKAGEGNRPLSSLGSWRSTDELHLHGLVEDLTYGELDDSREHLWSVLYLIGYLTRAKGEEETEAGMTRLVIPNREIREIFIEKIRKWFAQKAAVSGNGGLYDEIWDCDAAALQERIRGILFAEKDCCVRAEKL